MNINELLSLMVEKQASDLHLKVGSSPSFRINGEYTSSGFPVLTADEARDLMGQMTTVEQKQQFDDELELDFAYAIPDIARFRVNVFLQNGALASVIRLIPLQILTIEDLNLPPILKTLSEKPKGLVLITGPTGCGKSTTIAAMVDHINSTSHCHIITIEDPVEFLHKEKLAIIDQREVGRDTLSFQSALKRVLRQNPDVIVIGEVRDLETMTTAITAAETGHLVFATLHTNSAAETIDRVVDMFPSIQQQQIRSQLSLALEAVICQVLVPRANGKGRVVALEIMLANSAIRNQIRVNDLAQISSTIMTSKDEGMQTLELAFKNLISQNIITLEEAMSHTRNIEALKRLVAR